jgi:predicted kinase
MHSLIVLRGLPGSGKTTLAMVLSENKWPVISIDSYFTDHETGSYRFEYDKNHLAYRQCQEQVEAAMQAKTEKTFVDNAFTLEWEMKPYFELASANGYTVFVLTVEHRHGGVNLHGVSDEQLKRMAEKYTVVLHNLK